VPESCNGLSLSGGWTTVLFGVGVVFGSFHGFVLLEAGVSVEDEFELTAGLLFEVFVSSGTGSIEVELVELLDKAMLAEIGCSIVLGTSVNGTTGLSGLSPKQTYSNN
jgi:hypothetical protein